jgi:hypothetical protein
VCAGRAGHKKSFNGVRDAGGRRNRNQARASKEPGWARPVLAYAGRGRGTGPCTLPSKGRGRGSPAQGKLPGLLCHERWALRASLQAPTAGGLLLVPGRPPSGTPYQGGAGQDNDNGGLKHTGLACEEADDRRFGPLHELGGAVRDVDKEHGCHPDGDAACGHSAGRQQRGRA